MTTITATNLRKNIFELLSNTAKYNEILNVTTKDGSVVIMSEDDYQGLMETVYLYSQPKVINEILKAKAEPLENCVFEDEVAW
ncbi:MAG: type II toxin-antitoxin system Phd/YefM family antitoxin [Phascolarctobacterium sp.]|nr:type II toxin-antitoxin system Phd/YefM family antitoxin [Phascolarctobacterium sp.]